MSPERKVSNPVKVHEQELSRRIRQLNTPSWETVRGMLDIRTRHKPRLQSLLTQNIDELRIYYNTVYLATIEGEKPPRPDLNNGHNKTFSAHYRIVRETVTGNIERKSAGYRKYIRRQKAASRRQTH